MGTLMNKLAMISANKVTYIVTIVRLFCVQAYRYL